MRWVLLLRPCRISRSASEMIRSLATPCVMRRPDSRAAVKGVLEAEGARDADAEGAADAIEGAVDAIEGGADDESALGTAPVDAELVATAVGPAEGDADAATWSAA